jgi:hypothetical protein
MACCHVEASGGVDGLGLVLLGSALILNTIFRSIYTWRQFINQRGITAMVSVTARRIHSFIERKISGSRCGGCYSLIRCARSKDIGPFVA